MPRSPLADARARVLAPVRLPLFGASVVMAAAALLGIAPILLIVEAARRMLAPPVDWSAVLTLMLWAVAVLGLRGLVQALALLWSHLIDARHQQTLRGALVDKLGRLPLTWFSRRSSGEIKKILQDDISALHYLVAHAQLEVVAAITVPVATLAYLFWVDWRLALVLLAPLLAYAVALRLMMGRGYADRLAQYEQWQKTVEGAVIEFVDGIAVVRAFGEPRKAHARYQEAVDGYSDFFRAWTVPMLRIEAAATALLAPPFVMVLVLSAGLLLLSSGTIAPVTILPFLLLGLGLGGSVLTLGYGAQALRQAATAAERLHGLEQTPELAVASAPAAPPEGPVRVEFDDVSFAYGETDVVRDISLALEPGTLTALVGPSGSGKSTLAKLLPRFADPRRGAVRIGGVDLRDLDPTELYRLVGFVLQDVALLRGSVRDNIAIARPDASDADLEMVARAAGIHDRILRLPRGYDSEIGVDARLSGGEAQRVAIARALLSDTPIVVLDEATAFADPESEAAIQDALATLVAGRTVLVIAHRLHTITGADRIVVFDGGRIVQQGAHDDLVGDDDGLYARLWAANERARDRIESEVSR